MQGESPPVQVKEPYSSLHDYLITCRLSFCKTGVYNVRLLIVLERGCSSIYRKKERLDKPYPKEPFLAFLKAILVICTIYV